MAEEANAAKVAPSSKAAPAASNNGTGGGSLEGQVKEEVGALVRSPNDANPTLRAQNPTIYQADVVEGEATTEKPAAEGAEAAAGSPMAPAGEAAEMPAADAAATPPAAPAEGAEAMPAEGTIAPGSPAAADMPAGEAAAPMSPEGEEAKSMAAATESPAAPAMAMSETTMAPGTGAGAAPGVAAGMATSAGPATGSPTPKDPYAIDIPLDKKINKRTQRKLWEEIEKRKPLVPKHVAQHIQKYAKPPFETYSCKFRGKGSCSGCK